jgi:hypothetical protein
MKLSQKFNVTGRDPINGAKAGIYESFQPVEVANALIAGSGPGVPDVNGTPTPGTIEPGHIVAMSASGDVALATSPDLSAAHSIMMWVVFSGDDDFSGSMVGQVNCFHGGARFDTEKFNVASSYTPGLPLIANGGSLDVKVLADNKQIVGYVGPRGVVNGVLDVFMPQSAGARY